MRQVRILKVKAAPRKDGSRRFKSSVGKQIVVRGN